MGGKAFIFSQHGVLLLVYYCGMKREILGFPRPVPREIPRGGHPEGFPEGPYFPIYSTIVSF
jgi:hypothetical protein